MQAAEICMLEGMQAAEICMLEKPSEYIAYQSQVECAVILKDWPQSFKAESTTPKKSFQVGKSYLTSGLICSEYADKKEI